MLLQVSGFFLEVSHKGRICKSLFVLEFKVEGVREKRSDNGPRSRCIHGLVPYIRPGDENVRGSGQFEGVQLVFFGRFNSACVVQNGLLGG